MFFKIVFHDVTSIVLSDNTYEICFRESNEMRYSDKY